MQTDKPIERIKPHSWLVIAAIGFIFIYWGLHQLVFIPGFPESHWDWLTADLEVLEYIKWWFQIHGIWTMANGLFFTLAAAAAFRNGEPWSRWVLAYLPIHVALLTIPFYWLAVVTIPLALIAAVALRWGWNREPGRPAFPPRPGWLVFIPIAALIVYYAFDNLVVIPALDPADPARGWDWLTTDPATIDYFKFYFRVLGIRVFSIGLLTFLTAYLGLRRGYRNAWWILWILPILLLAHVFFWPWFAAILFGLALLTAIGLALSFPRTREVYLD